MFENSEAFSGLSAKDTAAVRDFYQDVMGLTVTDEGMGGMVGIHLPKGGVILVYPKPDHEPARYTVLNFPVDDIDVVVDELVSKGVSMLRYDGMHQDDRGISRGTQSNNGPDIAWFTDPAGHILAVMAD